MTTLENIKAQIEETHRDRQIYGAEPGIVEKGTAHGFPYMVVTFGSHPCAYVAVDERHPLHGVRYDGNYDLFDEIEVHGGVTFTDRKPCFCEESNLWWIGWDYNHYRDYNARMMRDFPGYGMFEPLRKWTLHEILMDVESAARKLKEMELGYDT